MRRPHLAILALLTPLVLAVLPAQSAQAFETHDAYLVSCIARVTGNPIAPCQAGGNQQINAAAASPDGSLFVTSGYGLPDAGAYGVQLYTRDASTGALTQATGVNGCFTTNGHGFDGTVGGCTTVSSFGITSEIAFAPDSSSMYVTTGAGFAALERTPGTTTFAYAACFGGSAGCTAIRSGHNGGSPGNVVTDGTSLYFRDQNGVEAFSRSAGANHPLTQLPGAAGCYTQGAVAGCTNVTGISGTYDQLTLTATHVYAAADNPGGVAVFSRNVDGSLTQAAGSNACITSTGDSGSDTGACTDGPSELLGGQHVAVDATATHLYVGASYAMVVLGLNAAGEISGTVQCIAEGPATATCEHAPAVGLSTAVISPDGTEVVSELYGDNGIGFFHRDVTTGKLTPHAGSKACMTHASHDVCEVEPGLAGGQVAFVPTDALHVYAAGGPGFVGTLVLDVAPVCADATVDVVQGQPAPVTLACTDGNGDVPARTVVAASAHGTLGAIDAAGHATYQPAAGYTGPDTITYQGTDAQGVSGNVATVHVTVRADADGDGFAAPADCNDHDAKVKPGAVEIPGNAVDENCDGKKALGTVPTAVTPTWKVNGSLTKAVHLFLVKLPKGEAVTVRCIGSGKGCPFATKKLTYKVATAKADLAKLFTKLKVVAAVRAGAKIEIDLVVPYDVGKFVTFTTRAGKAPTKAVGCLAPGTTKHVHC